MKKIVFAGSLNLFHTNSMFYPYPLGITPYAYFQYVKRVESNKYNYQAFWINANNNSSSPATLDGGGYADESTTKTLSQIIDIHPDLECHKDGNERLLINYWFGAMCGNESSSKLGLLIMKPKWGSRGYSLDNKGSFSYVLIITPKPGLFPLKKD